jgi:hypothetical protein
MGSLLAGTRPSTRRGRAPLAVLWALAGALSSTACDDGNGPESLPLGRTGEVEIQVQTPLAKQGSLEQTVRWKSDGTWRLTERISYKGGLGDETVRQSTEDAGTLAQRYANLVALVNAPGGAVQIVDLLSPDVVPFCAPEQSIVSIGITDSRRSTTTRWSRCGEGTLATLAADASSSDVRAGRVIEAAKQVRNATLDLDREFARQEPRYAYVGSLPFKTIERGEQAKVPLVVPRVIEDAASLAAFWTQYMTSATPTSIDFTNEVVLVGAVGTRQEAGDSVEIRRVLPIAHGTQIVLWERRPGNFCTPAPRVHAPFHVAVAPIAREPRPIFFELQIVPDRVPCG